MNKKLYYTVDYRDLEHGYRTISVYTIENNEPTLWFELVALHDDLGVGFYTDEEEIQNYLDDNGYEEENISMIQL